MDVPAFIYGTAWKEDDTARLTELAVETGFRGIDTANQPKHYNEPGVGDALQKILNRDEVSRDELFLQTKFTYPRGQGPNIPYDPELPPSKQVEESFERSLEHLGIDFIDAYILHGPKSPRGLTDADREVWETFTGLYRDGKVGAIGVSNMTPSQLEALADWSDVTPEFIQNRCFARAGWDHQTRQVCSEHDIRYQGFSLLTANKQELRTELVANLAEKHDKTVPQVIFRFAMQIGMTPLTGTTSRKHMEEDLACTDFTLSDSEIEELKRVGV